MPAIDPRKRIQISDNIIVLFYEGYKRIKLPLKRKWLTALRSDDFKQGQRLLCNSAKEYCCLGVLSKLQGRLTEDGKDGIIIEHGENIAPRNVLGDDNPMRSVLKAIGVFPDGVSVKIISKMLEKRDLAALNDEGVSFKDIADIIHAIWKE
jgi:hypothetical protein